ncbi:arylamine N-acetyltransferase [Actinoplanes sp. NPDC051851]|uniref:arylamine N-acetyltransferase family protein n=1 Tax=Actinoplanes sp. NPDC051851 TaxID=3154753 RepID=UPI003413E2E6
MGNSIDVVGYLGRLGLRELAGAPPSAAGLSALHRAHAERVPYEGLAVWLGETTTVEPAESVERILRGRGGYCFHLNGAFAALLDALGYAVTRHFGGVQGNATRPAGANGNHVVLTVAGLPDEDAPDGEWLVDLGMGDGLHAPLPLVAGDHRQGPFRYALRTSAAEPGGWRFDHDPRGSFLGMDFRAEAVGMPAFAEMHRHLTTSPESGFVQVLVVARRDAGGADILRGRTLTRIGEDSRRTTVESADDYFAVLAELFGIPLGELDSSGRAALWRRVSAAHDEWRRQQDAA